MFEIWVSIALLGIFSCVSTIYVNSRKDTKKIDEIIKLLRQIAEHRGTS
jgi:hypothetical protein